MENGGFRHAARGRPGCSGSSPAATISPPAAVRGSIRLDRRRATPARHQSITVGSANFPENVAARRDLRAGARGEGLRRRDEAQHRRPRGDLPQRSRQGELTVLPEYSGALLSYLTEAKSDAKEINRAGRPRSRRNLPDTLTVLTPSAAEDKDTITCNKETVDKYGLTCDRGPRRRSATRSRSGGPPEFAKREGLRHQGAQARLRRRVQEVPAARRGRPADRRRAQGQQGPVRQPVQHAVGDPGQRLRHARGPEGPRRGGGACCR